jgi:ADP-L-glycero-D-manno-heptose 6-epimerase
MIVVTGGAGFIGSNLVRGLNRRGASDILVADDLKNSSKHLNLSGSKISDYVDKGDLIDELPRMGAIDAIFHQGACTSTTESDGRYMMSNNFSFSKALLHFALGKRVPFLYASSAAVYGDGQRGFRERAGSEYPLNVYAFSKLVFDRHVEALLPSASSPVVGLRYFNVYGPQENHKGRMASVASQLYREVTTQGTMRLFEGSEKFRRDFVHVEDVVAVNLAMFEKSKNGIFNCGTGTARSFVDVANALLAAHGSGRVEFIPFPNDLVGKYQEFTEADLTALRAAGCHVPFQSLEQGVASYYDVLERSGGYYPSWT